MQVFVSWVGKYDPIGGSPLAGPEDGPILAALTERPFDAVHLLATPAMAENTDRLVREIGRRHPGLPVAAHTLAVPDPYDFETLWYMMRDTCDAIVAEADGDADLVVLVSNGTPTMRTTWFVLAASGLVRARLVYVRRSHEAVNGRRLAEAPLPGLARGFSHETNAFIGRWFDDVSTDRSVAPSAPSAAPSDEGATFADADAEPSPVRRRFLRDDEIQRKRPAMEMPIGQALRRMPEIDPETILRRQNAQLVTELEAFYRAKQTENLGIVGESAPIVAARNFIRAFAQSDEPVLISGESGTGKELAAQAIRMLGPRAKEPFIVVNCAAIPEHLAVAELFGHTAGAFTGATNRRPGAFETADRGTLFLDELGHLPHAIQPMLLRAVQQGEIQPLGGHVKKVNVRLICATSRDLGRAVADGAFLDELRHRISVLPLELPPLRARVEDIPLLAAHLLERKTGKSGGPPKTFTAAALDLLARYDWPGNVRELEGCIGFMLTLARGDVLDAHHVRPDIREKVLSPAEREPGGMRLPIAFDPERMNLAEARDEFERFVLAAMLRATHDNAETAAQRLEVSPAWVRERRGKWWPDHKERFG